MAAHDIPSILKYIVSKTYENNKIIYIGHSQGTTSILAGLCEDLEFYQQRIKCLILLAPAAKLDFCETIFFKLLSCIDFTSLFQEKEVYEVNQKPSEFAAKVRDSISGVFTPFFQGWLEMTTDENMLINCSNRLKVYFAHFPSGSSLKSVSHFKQLFNYKCFQQYDYGEEINLQKYKSKTPKIYDLKKIKGMKIIIGAGVNDKMTDINGVRWIKEELGSNIYSYYEFKSMGHLSFLLCNDISWFNCMLKDIYQITTDNKEDMILNTGMFTSKLHEKMNLNDVSDFSLSSPIQNISRKESNIDYLQLEESLEELGFK